VINSAQLCDGLSVVPVSEMETLRLAERGKGGILSSNGTLLLRREAR
jgi:hypothetical protein